MRGAVRPLAVAFVVAVSAALIGSTSGVVLTATALIMGGTGHSLAVPEDTPDFVQGYVTGANDSHIVLSGLCGTDCRLAAVYTPEQFKFDTGLTDMTFDESVDAGRQNLDKCLRGTPCTVTEPPYGTTADQSVTDPESSYVVYGYSQSAVVATLEKRHLVATPQPDGTTVSFVLIANPDRPNGGMLERFVGMHIPVLGVTSEGATPTDTEYTTVDIAAQYDGWADFPLNPLNLLADANAVAGIFFLHGHYFGAGTPQLQGQYQDTTYYLIPTKTLPLLAPLAAIPIVGQVLADVLDPPLRVMVEAAYDRTINPGQPTPANFHYSPNLAQTGVNLAHAVAVGVDNGISDVTGTRPLGTQPQGVYGVGGPPVDSDGGPPPPKQNKSLPHTTRTLNADNGSRHRAPVKKASKPSPDHSRKADRGDARKS